VAFQLEDKGVIAMVSWLLAGVIPKATSAVLLRHTVQTDFV